MSVLLLVLQLLVLLLWLMTSVRIILLLLRGDPASDEAVDLDEAPDRVTRFLNDPATRRLRGTWLVLTAALLFLSTVASDLFLR